MCTPLSVLMTSLISPTWSAYVASSNGFCICPGRNQPRSPPDECDEQSECTDASLENVLGEPLISDSYPRRMVMASSFEHVMFGCVMGTYDAN